MIRALAQKHDLPVYVFDLSSLTNTELTHYWRNMQEAAPCIALMEDIDGVFHGRENVAVPDGGGLTFDCLLNCLGGIETADGVFLMVTTNNIEHVDPALGIPTKDGNGSTRPGRMDRCIEFLPMTREQARAIVERILGEWPGEVERTMAGLRLPLTGAQVTELCVQRALALFWGGDKHPHATDTR
jgi:SpoVK/Ycf46/Vps4 family AAA+-type ATPase